MLVFCFLLQSPTARPQSHTVSDKIFKTPEVLQISEMRCALGLDKDMPGRLFSVVCDGVYQSPVGSNQVSDEAASAHVVLEVSTDLHFEPRSTFGQLI